MRKTLMTLVLVLAALAVGPAVHHHPLVPSGDHGSSPSLQTLCGVCLHVKVILPPAALPMPPLGSIDLVEAISIVPATTVDSSLAPSRAPPRLV